MTVKKRLLPVAVAMVLASSCVYADGKHEDGHAAGVSPDQAIAMVNGKPISKLTLDRVTEQLTAQGQQPSNEQIIEELINLEILTQEAERLELHKQDDVATALQLQYTQTMANAFLGEYSKGLKIEEADIRAEYEKQIAEIKASEYKARHILVDSEAEAVKIIDELNAGGDFAALAKTHSTGPTGENGGDLGWFQPENMVAEFSAAVSLLEKGQVTDNPVQTDFGWHIIRLDDLRAAAKPDYSPAVKAGIQNTLLRDAMAKKVEELRAAAKVEMK